MPAEYTMKVLIKKVFDRKAALTPPTMIQADVDGVPLYVKEIHADCMVCGSNTINADYIIPYAGIRIFKMINTALFAVCLASPAYAWIDSPSSGPDLLLKQNNGTYESVRPGTSSQYDVKPFNGQKFAPVYNKNGSPAGSVVLDGSGSAVFYDNKGNRK